MTAGDGAAFEADVGPVAHGGACVARAPDGRVVFVRHALPGERVRAVVTDERPGYLRADAVAVLQASPDRVRPPCPHAGPGRCGGCDWQHVRLPRQRELKAAVVRAALREQAGLDVDVRVQPVQPVQDGLGWRTRVAFTVTPEGVAGLRRHRSHAVHPVECCRIAHPSVTAVGAGRLRWPGAASVEVAAAPGSGDRLAVLTPRGRRAPVVPAGLPSDVSVAVAAPGARPARALRGRPGTREAAAGREFWVGAGGFWQVHPGAADLLASTVRELAAAQPGEAALDLYAGVGLFAWVLARDVGERGHVLAVEADPRAAADARQNLRDLPQVSVRAARAEDAVRAVDHRPDLVVLDPPRTGAGRGLLDRIAAFGPRRVVHVACDPVSLGRDVAALGKHGFALRELRAFDLFPMTAHVECVALLERR